ncbi:MAG: hypothetical protein ACRCTP_04810 [Aeromonas popoffii]|uniref:hypothetical protein n=1 Tax=Aeromonas popoffii TaxID=70856 RepID=UPI003F3F3C4E
MKQVTWSLVFGLIAMTTVACLVLSGCSVTNIQGKAGDMEASVKTYRVKGETNMTISKDTIWVEANESQKD